MQSRMELGTVDPAAYRAMHPEHYVRQWIESNSPGTD